ncbi:MAG: hypothetical protein JRE23_01185 [Deltaproteobacteria bacterium]|nr:hypothetical protein [Deltaproteobacteria bacterium]
MKVYYQSIGKSLSIGIALFGAWSLYAQTLMLFRADFTTLKTFSIIPVLGVIALLFCIRNRHEPQPGLASCFQETRHKPFLRLPQWFWFLTPFVLAGFFALTGLQWLCWLLSAVYLLAAKHAFSSDSSPKPMIDPKSTVWELIGLTCICGIVVFLSLGAHRPDADDAFFVSLASAAIDNPEEPLYGFDNLYRSGLPLVEQHLHFGQTYEYFIAVLADFTGIPVRVLYYVLLPALLAPIGILVYWILLRRFLPRRSALIGLTGLVIILALWGDGHHTYGNFAFVRMFQGKAIYLMVALPMIVHSALEYTHTPSRRNWLFLMLHQCAAVGFTINGLVVAPLASALILLSRIQFSRTFRRGAMKGLAAGFPLVLVGIGMIYHLRSYHVPEQVDPLFLGYQALGINRVSLVLLGLLILPALSRAAKLRESAWLSSYVFISSALLLCPAVPKFLGLNLAPVFSWRIFWCWPVPLLLCLTIGAATIKSLPRPWFGLCLLGIALAAFALAGPRAVNRNNWNFRNMGTFKVTQSYKVAQHLMGLSPNNGLTLVPEDLAVNLCGFRGAPPLIAVRQLYLKKLRGSIPEQDWADRFSLLAYIGGMTKGLRANWVMEQIDTRGITTVAFRYTHPHTDSLVKSLVENNFRVTRYSGYILAIRPQKEE